MSLISFLNDSIESEPSLMTFCTQHDKET